MKQQATRYKAILFPEKSPFSDYACGHGRSIGPLSLVKIFIGANNSGKSRMLRALYSLKEFQYTTDKYSARPIYELVATLSPEFDDIFVGNNLDTIGPIPSQHFREVLDLNPDFISPSRPIYQLAKSKFEKLSKLAGVRSINTAGPGPLPPQARNEELTSRLSSLGNRGLLGLSELGAEPGLGDEQRWYIPILRGMRPLGSQENPYGERTVSDYFGDGSDAAKNFIFTGLELYSMLKRKLLGEPEDRESIRHYEEFLSRRFFESLPVTLIPFEGDNTVRVKIGSEKQLPIYHLGDGLQNLIICTFRICMAVTPSLFFIEEPDMGMHPSLQRSFLEVLSEYDQHQYFLTSHSNHLLDMTIDFTDTSIFHFTKVAADAQARFQIRVASSRDRNVLLDLGVRNSSVFLANATLWVEGITDRLYLRTYMGRYVKELETNQPDLAKVLMELKEDYHYAFVEYQGANLTHWTFDPLDENMKRINASFLCAHAFLIADGDVVDKGDRAAIYKAMLGDNFEILPTKEIENLIPPEVLKEVIADALKEHSIDKEQIRYEEYSKQGLGLGKYIDGLLGVSDEKAVYDPGCQ